MEDDAEFHNTPSRSPMECIDTGTFSPANCLALILGYDVWTPEQDRAHPPVFYPSLTSLGLAFLSTDLELDAHLHTNDVLIA